MKRLTVLFLVLTCLLALTLTGCDSSDYKKAVSLYDNGQYQEAMAAFEALGDYQDSAQRVLDCKLGLAKSYLESGAYQDALPILRELGNYQDAPTMRRSAAYAVARAYVKENGSAFSALGDKLPIDGTTFPCAITEKDGVAFNFVALDSNDNLVMGTGRDTSSAVIGVSVWGFWATVPETGNIANTDYWSGLKATVSMGPGDVRSMSNAGRGQSSFDITAYTETMNMDMEYTSITTNYLGEETTEKKTLSYSYNSEAMAQMSEAPVAAEALLTGSGVTLGDLGFILMDKAAPASAAADATDAAAAEEAPAADSAADASGSAAAAVPEGAIDLKTKDGQAEIKYAGWEYLPDGVMADESVDTSKVIVVKMDYTNYREDDANQMQNDFWFRVYQNGVELDTDFGSYYADKYKPLEDYFKSVMMGGTVTTGKYFMLEDTSPITIIANEQGTSDNKQSMTVELN